MEKLFALVESDPFMYRVAVMNTLATLTSAIDSLPEFNEVYTSYLAKPSDAATLIKSRIERLSSVSNDPQYAHPYDAAIAVYLYLFFKLNQSEYRSFIRQFNLPENTWWSLQMRQVLDKLLSPESTTYIRAQNLGSAPGRHSVASTMVNSANNVVTTHTSGQLS